jgi:hypothetical protein
MALTLLLFKHWTATLTTRNMVTDETGRKINYNSKTSISLSTFECAKVNIIIISFVLYGSETQSLSDVEGRT